MNSESEIQDDVIVYEELSDNYRNLRNRLLRKTVICIVVIIIIIWIIALIVLGMYK